MTTNCAYCGKPFDTENILQKYCSANCKVAATRKARKENPDYDSCIPSQICVICGKEFTPADHRPQKYCSKECRYQAIRDYNRIYFSTKKHSKKPRICPVCGKEFNPVTSQAKCCSTECCLKYQEQLREYRKSGKSINAPYYNPRAVYGCAEFAVADDIMEYFSEKWFAIDAELPWYQKHTSTLMNDPYPV